MKTLLFLAGLLSLSVATAQKEASYDPTNDLSAVFKCRGNGPLNAQAAAESQSLVNILSDISNDTKCQGLKTSLQQVANLNVAKTLSQPDSKINLEGMVNEVANLQLAIIQESSLGAEGDQVYLAALKKNSAELRIKINNQTENQKMAPRKARIETLENIDTYSTSLMANLEQQDGCFTNRASTPGQIGAQVLSLASGLGSAFTGGLILTAGKAIDHFVRFMRAKGLNNDIQNIVNTRVGLAAGCAFEAISRTYCQAADYDVLLTADREAGTQTAAEPTWKKGMKSTAQGTSAFTEFANGVDGGSPKTTPGRVSDVQSALGLKAQLELNLVTKDYLTITGFNKVTAETDEKAKINAFKKLLSELGTLITPPCMSMSNNTCLAIGGPFKSSFIEDTACGPLIYVYTKGQSRTMAPGTGNVTCPQYITSLKPQPTIADLPKIKEAMDSIFNEATIEVTNENSKVRKTSNIQVLASARLKIANRTVLDYFDETGAYLDSLLKDPGSISAEPSSRRQIEQTLGRIRAVQELLKKVPANEVEADEIVGKIANEIIPKGDTAAIPSALNLIVQLDVEKRIAKGEVDPTLASLMQMPNAGSVGQLLQIFGTADSSGQQTRNARQLSRSNLSGLASALNQSLQASFESLKGKDEDSVASLATLCIQAASVPEAPGLKGLDLNSYCKGSVMKSLNDPSLVIKYDDVIKGPDRKKTCALHDFYRKSDLFVKKKEFTEDKDRGVK